MAAWSLYGVFLPPKEEGKSPRWALTTNKKRALHTARVQHGYVMSIPYAGSGPAWDAPTFRHIATMVEDYRDGEHGSFK